MSFLYKVRYNTVILQVMHFMRKYNKCINVLIILLFIKNNIILLKILQNLKLRISMVSKVFNKVHGYIFVVFEDMKIFVESDMSKLFFKELDKERIYM